jgi:dihydrofolate synthase/folylpolyglutamate synthase
VNEISREKLASLRPGATLILGTEDPVVDEIAREVAGEIGARVVRPTPVSEASPRRQGFAPYVLRNVRLGARVAEEVLGRTLDRDGLARVEDRVAGLLPARFEVREVRGVPVVVDGGHNAAGVRATLESVREIYGDRPLGLVFGALRDKDVASMLTALERETSVLVLTRPDSERAAEPEWIRRSFEPRDRRGRPARVVTYPGDALGLVVEEMSRVNGVVLVTGSLYTAAAVLEVLRES